MLNKITLIAFLVFTCYSYTQEPNETREKEERHSLSFVLSHTYISQGKIEGNRKWLAAPSFGLNYNFKISEKWSVGLHNDIIIESFVVENTSSSEEILEREYPISNLIVGSYKLHESWSLAAGAGMEWEKNENFAVIRLGTEYVLELNEKGLELIFALNYDALIDAYDSVNFGIGINKFFK